MAKKVLVDETELNRFLGTNTPGPNLNSELIADIQDEVIASFEDEFDRPLVLTPSYERVFDSCGGETLTLPSEVTVSTPAPRLFTRTHPAGGWYEINSAAMEFHFRRENRTTDVLTTGGPVDEIFGATWPIGNRLVRAIYPTGWDKRTVPSDLKGLIKEEVRRIFRDRNGIAQRVSSDTSTSQQTSPMSDRAKATRESFQPVVVDFVEEGGGGGGFFLEMG